MNITEIINAEGRVSDSVLARLNTTTFVGIDFGTSTTTVTRLVYDSEYKQLVSEPLSISQEDADGICTSDHLVPSVIAMKPDGHLLFGSGAKACLVDDERFAEGYNVWTRFKMKLGENACYPHTMMSSAESPVNGDYIETPKDAARLFFSFLKKGIEAAVARDGLPSTIKYAVTVPASFAPNQREELCSAIGEAGMELAPGALLDEPNSAFMGAAAYYAEMGGMAAFFRDDTEANVLVFDFGAGTCDISLLQVGRNGTMQNIAISHFTALGGSNIDRMIAEDILYPQLTAGRTGDDLPVLKIKENIINKLCPVAEELKIQTCKKYDSDTGEMAFPSAMEAPDDCVETSFVLNTRRYGTFESSDLALTAGEFVEVMEKFTEPALEAFDNGHKSIFEPIDEVLRKANISKEGVAFVLMIGGSSRNPFVRQRIEEYFPRSTQVLVPGDIQTLVARGAAVHSFAVNGFGQSFITPITSEDIFIKTKNGRVCIFPAGSRVPSEKKAIDGLYIDDDTATAGTFGIPFYASVNERKLGVARFELLDLGRGCDVQLECSMDANKNLCYEIHADGMSFKGTFAMPESSEAVSADEIEYVKAKNALDLVALRNRGLPTVEQYKKVAEACVKLEKNDTAAEYYRSLMYDHRSAHYEYEASKCFRDAGMHKEALAWIRRACDYRKTYLNVWYLVWDLFRAKGWGDPETSKWLEYALDKWPDDLDFKYVDMKAKKALGLDDAAQEIAEELCDEWEYEGVTSLSEYSLSRFEEVARICEKEELLKEIRKQLKILRKASKAEKDGSDYTLIGSNANDEAISGGKS